ncbi:MAG TPA: 50S ribosomal protein L17 [Desulfobacterales bacterium]|nr:50S ribosomal protein L17 [Desulfobacterales bacterium]
MRHSKAGLKLNRTSSHRDAMFRNLVTSLFKHDRIRTTDAKAKELKRWADRMITLAKRGDLHARRQVLSVIREKEVVYKLFDEAVDRYGNISGGYTRVVKIGVRPGDAASISLVELAAPEKSRKKKKDTKIKEKTASGKKKPAKEKAKKAVRVDQEKTEAEEKEPEDKTV